MANEITADQIVHAGNIKFYFEDLGETLTVRGYLVNLLRSLWAEGEGFNSKRPYGNSGWEFDLYRALVDGGAIKGTLDEDGYLEDFDRQAGIDMIYAIIDSLEGNDDDEDD
jgi:hypothetical protein